MDFLQEFIEELIMSSLSSFLDPDQRVYFVGIIVSAILTIWVYRGKDLGKNLRSLFSKRQWWNDSAKLDYKSFLIWKSVINPFWLPIYGTVQLAIIFAMDHHLVQAFGRPETGHWPHWLIYSLFTVSIFLFDDFAYYLVHRCMHRWKPLWEFHKVHHSATTLNPFSVYRAHPIELLINRCRYLLTVSITSGIFYYFFINNFDMWKILGVHALAYIFNVSGALLRHSSVPLSYPKWIEDWLISPVQHQLHHSCEARYWDCNFGVTLALWDKVFGSLEHSPMDYKTNPTNLGVIEEGQLLTQHGFFANFFMPFYKCFTTLKFRKSGLDKVTPSKQIDRHLKPIPLNQKKLRNKL